MSFEPDMLLLRGWNHTLDPSNPTLDNDYEFKWLCNSYLGRNTFLTHKVGEISADDDLAARKSVEGSKELTERKKIQQKRISTNHNLGKNEMSLFGALIRRRFDVSSHQYNNIDLLSLSFPIASNDDQLQLFPTRTPTKNSNKTEDKGVAIVKSNPLTTSSLTEVKKSSPRKKKALLRPYFSMTSMREFHNVLYGQAIPSLSESTVKRSFILAIQGFESEIFTIDGPRRFICAGYSLLSLHNLSQIFYTILLQRKLLACCMDSLKSLGDQIYSSLSDAIQDLLVAIDANVNQIQNHELNDSTTSISNIYHLTSISRMLIYEIFLLFFPKELMQIIHSTGRSTASLSDPIIQKYLMRESWIQYQRSREAWNVFVILIDRIFHLSSVICLLKSRDIYPVIIVEQALYQDSQNDRLSETFLKLLISSYILKKVSSMIMQSLSARMFRYQNIACFDYLSSCGGYLSLSPATSLCVSISQITIPSQEIMTGQDFMMYILSIYIWSVCRLDLLFLLYDNDDKALHVDMNSQLVFPFNESDIQRLQNVTTRTQAKCWKTEEVLRSMILSWSESKESALRKQAIQIRKDLQEELENLSKDVPDETSPSEGNKLSSLPPNEAKDGLSMETEKQEDVLVDSLSETTRIYPVNILNPGGQYDENLFERAKAEIISKYAKLTQDVDRRRSIIQWRQTRALNMNQARGRLQALFQYEREIWTRKLSLNHGIASSYEPVRSSEGISASLGKGRINTIDP